MTSVGHEDYAPNALGLQWLLRLRWIAVLGQIVVCVVCVAFLRVDLPIVVLAGCIGLTALTNFLFWSNHDVVEERSALWTPVIIFLDILILTIMLFFAGGAHNPFTVIYLLHIALAVVLLPGWAAWLAVAFCGLCFAALFTSDHKLVSDTGETCCTDMSSHLQGMFVGMLAAGAGLTYFVSQLNASLTSHRKALEKARHLSEQHERFASLATLAAGVAHELATPLATIAVVSKDLEQLCCAAPLGETCRADARLILQEVERCKTVIEKLGARPSGNSMEESVVFRIGEISALLGGYLPERIAKRLEMKIEQWEDEVCLPLPRVLQCLAILVKNAAEASAPGESVLLTVSKTPGLVRFGVRDKGCGMPDEIIERLGEPFFTTKETGSGMGLGLFLVRTFVEQRNGKFHVESSPGSGTSIEIQLPLTEKIRDV
ncbi:MAG: ATP-binding protein [Terrimicrobiaceae bacterium]